MKTSSVIVGGLSVMALAIGMNQHFRKKTATEGLWSMQSKELENGRFPASFPIQIDPELYKDFFVPSTFGHSIQYDMTFRFSTDLDKSYLQKKTKKALEQALAKTFMQANLDPAQGLTALLKKNLISEVMKNFVKTLRVYKIFDGNFQIDLIFTPKKISNLDFKEEMASNQLINFDNKGELLSKFDNSKKTIPNKVTGTKVPTNGQTYQYMGGVISLGLELVDLTPKFKLPSPKKNIVKGNVQLRRYMRINERKNINLSVRTQNHTTDMLHIDKTGKTDKFITVDINKKFNLSTPIPKLDTLVVHFGKVVDKETRKRSLWDRFTNFFTSEDIQTSKFNLYGKLNGNEYKAQLKKLVYDFDKKEFTNSSDIDVKFKYHSGEKKDESRDAYKVKSKIIKDSKSVISQLRLNQFHKDI